MHCFEETRVIPVNVKLMYDLVMDVDAYPAFVPWMSAVEVLTRSENDLSAELTVDLAGIQHKFQTSDHFEPHHLIEVHLLSGPFQFLESVWTFKEMGSDSCEVHFSIEFEFKSALLDMVASPVFGAACRAMVKTFEKRALSFSEI